MRSGEFRLRLFHKLTGVLVHSVEGCAYQIRYLLTHPEFARQLGKNGQEHVKENFLTTRNLKRWLLLLRLLLQAPSNMGSVLGPRERGLARRKRRPGSQTAKPPIPGSTLNIS